MDKSRIFEIHRFADKKALIISIIFTIVFVLWEIIFLEVPLLKHLVQSFYSYGTKYFIYLHFLVFVTFGLFAFFVYTALISPKVIKFFLAGLFVSIIFFEYGYLKAFGEFSAPVDIEIALFYATAEQRLASTLSYFNWLSLVPCLAFLCLVYFFKPNERTPGRNFLFIVPIISAMAFYSFSEHSLRKIYLADYPLISFENFFKSFSEISPTWLMTEKSSRIQIERKDFEPPADNIVFIVDESVRAGNLSLYGYSRETTAYLEKLSAQGKLKKIDSCVSATTCSRTTGFMLLTGLRVDDLPDENNRKAKTYPTLFQYAQAMGYKVHFLDGQMSSYWLSPYVYESYIDLQFIDSWLNVDNFRAKATNDYDVDFEIARRAAEILKSSKGNFIWIWKRGLHFPYYKNFPKEKAVWQPSPDFYRLDSYDLEELTNNYDNSIKYNLDEFFRILYPAIADSNARAIYTSDHGQNLREAGYLATHCETSRNEANVPLFMLGKDLDKYVDSSFKAAHSNIFPTILDLLKVPEELRKKPYADSLLDKNAKPKQNRYFWTQDLERGRKHLFD